MPGITIIPAFLTPKTASGTGRAGPALPGKPAHDGRDEKPMHLPGAPQPKPAYGSAHTTDASAQALPHVKHKDGNPTGAKSADDSSRTKPHAPVPPIRGRVFALKDGSGYAELGSDGNYYRVQGGSGHGMTLSLTESYVASSMVNIAGGPVSSMNTAVAKKPAALDPEAANPSDAPKAEDVHLPGSKDHSGAASGMPADQAPIDTGEHAAASSHDAQSLIAQDPQQAVHSQANLSPESALALLR